MDFSCHIFIGKTDLRIKSKKLENDQELPRERKYQVTLGRRQPIEVALLEFYSPAICLASPYVLIWGGVRMYCLSMDSGQIIRMIEREDESLAAYPLGENWCIVGETSLEVFDSTLEIIKQSISFEEVILNIWWDSDRLFLRDLQQRLLAFDAVPGGRLIQVPLPTPAQP
jgi:hypothetical protein